MRKLKFKFPVLIMVVVLIANINLKAVELKGSLFSHDPATLTKDNDTYWHFYTAPGVRAASSKDLINWTSSSNRVFTSGANWKQNYPAWTIPYFGTTNTDGNIWAPDVIYMNGAYYLYYSCSSFGSSYSAIGVAKSPSLNNPVWVDLGKVVSSSSSSQINAIDPGLFRDTDGKIYMVYGSWSGGIGIVDIDSVTGLATSTVTKLYGGVSGSRDTEAAALFKEGAYYYLVVNRANCCNGVSSTYYMLVGRSTSVKGTYEGFRTLLPNKDPNYPKCIGPGHFGLLRDTCANYVSIHFYNANAGGAATLDILKMKMVDGWPVLYRDFTFDNCYDELRINAGSDGEACKDLSFELTSLSIDPTAIFYSKLSWNDGNAEGSFSDSTLLKPVYTPPAAFAGNITLTLTAIGNDTNVVMKDSIVLSIMENSTTVDAGSNDTAYQGIPFDFSTLTTVPSATEYSKLLWDDGGAGGKFANKAALKPIYTPSTTYLGPVRMILSAFGETNCVIIDSMVLTVNPAPVNINSIKQNEISIYPNPSEDGSFTIAFTNNPLLTDEITIDIYKSDGSKVYANTLKPDGSVDFNLNPGSGIYMVYIRSGKNVFTEKMVIK